MADRQQVASFNGIIEGEDAVIVASLALAEDLLGFKISTLVIRSITLGNSHTVAAPFQLRKRIPPDDCERFLIDEDDEIKPNIPWKFGNLGGIKVLDNPEHYYDILMDSVPDHDNPISYIINFAYSL